MNIIRPELITLKRSNSQDGVTVNMNVEYGIWTDCGTYDCFLEKFAACEPAAIRLWLPGSETPIPGQVYCPLSVMLAPVQHPQLLASRPLLVGAGVSAGVREWPRPGPS